MFMDGGSTWLHNGDPVDWWVSVPDEAEGVNGESTQRVTHVKRAEVSSGGVLVLYRGDDHAMVTFSPIGWRSTGQMHWVTEPEEADV